MGKTTLRIGFMNAENLFSPGENVYGKTYTQEEYNEKIDWIGKKIAELQADVCALAEVGKDPDSCIDDLISIINNNDTTGRSPFSYKTHFSPSKSSTPIRAAIISRYNISNMESLINYPADFKVDLLKPGTSEDDANNWIRVPYEEFSRPIGKATINPPNATAFNLLVIHLKSKRPKLAKKDTAIYKDSVGMARSAIMRNMEAAALRCHLNNFLIDQFDQDPKIPTILVGDFNDVPNSVPLENIRGPFDKNLEPQSTWSDNDKIKLISAARLHMKKAAYDDKLFSYVHNESFTLIDQAFVTLHLTGKFKRFEVYNDHVLRHQTMLTGTEQEKRYKSTVTDHGTIVLELQRML